MWSQWWLKRGPQLFLSPRHCLLTRYYSSLPPSLQSFPAIPSPAGWWETMNLYPTCCHSFLPSTQSPVLPSLPSAALPLAVGKWTKAPLNRPMHSVKARGLDLSWRGETQFISGPDQLPAKRTSHPISRRLQHKKQEWGVGVCVGWWVCGGVGLGERGLWAGKSWWILDWFLNFSSLRRGGGEGWDKEEKQTPNTWTHTQTHTQKVA